MRELLSERLWRQASAAEARATKAALNRDGDAADRHSTRADDLKDQAREAESQGR